MRHVAARLVDQAVLQHCWVYFKLASRDSVSLSCKPPHSQLNPKVQTNHIQFSLVLFVVYFPRPTPATSPDREVTPSIEDDKTPTYRTALAVAGLCVLHAITLLIISLVIGLNHPSALQSWANFLGILAAVLSSTQYFPQIHTTLRIRCVGSLSIPMMCIQTPGSLIFAASLAARLGKEGWSSWGVFLVTACFQGVLLSMAVYFEYFGPERKEARLHDINGQTESLVPADADGLQVHHQHGELDGPPAEDTPLLQRQ